jgi:hypothetical protein
MLLGLTLAITELSTNAMRATEREHANEAAEIQTFYEVLFATIRDEDNADGTTTKTFKKAIINPVFAQFSKQTKTARPPISSRPQSKRLPPK